MDTITGRTVPKDRRTNGDISPNSGVTGALERDSERSSSGTGALRFRFDRYVLDLQRGSLLAGDEEVTLRPKAFEVLRHLVENPHRLVPKHELLAAVWPDVIVTEDSLVQCVSELRRALDDHDQRLIRTMPRRGYRFEATPVPESRTAGPPVKDASPVNAGADALTPDRHEPGANAGPPHLRMLMSIVGVVVLMAAAGTTWWWYGRSPAPPALSIVVLPFHNLGDDPDQKYFAEGVSSELTTELSRLPGIFVIAHATARTLQGKGIDAEQIGHELNVRYLLEGSVRRTGEQIRLNVQLVDATTGAAVWAERFERRWDELGAWQDEVIGRLGRALNLRITRLEGDRSLRERRDSPAAYDLAIRGWALVYTAKGPETYAAARALFEQALAQEPRAVNALVGLGWTAAVSVLDGWSAAPEADVATAEDVVDRALALDPNHFVAHHVRGFLFRLQKRSHSAHDAFETAIALNPSFAPGYAQLGATALELGRPQETVPAVERAIRLSPRDPNLGPWLAIAGKAWLHLGHYDDAAAWLTRAIDTGTPVAQHHAYLASALALAGRPEAARVALAEFRRMKPEATIARLRAQARSTEADFVAQQERFYEGLRLAGLPE